MNLVLLSLIYRKTDVQWNYLPTGTVAQEVKNPPAMWEAWVGSLGWEDPLEKGMATQSSILAWRIPWREEPGGLQSMGSQRVGHNWTTFTSLHIITSQKRKKKKSQNSYSLCLIPKTTLLPQCSQALFPWWAKWLWEWRPHAMQTRQHD